MRSSIALTILSAGALAAAFPKELKKTTSEDAVCDGDVYSGLCCVNGQWAGQDVASAVTGLVSSATSYYDAHSSSIQGDISTAVSKGAAWVSSNSGSISSFLTSNSAAIESDVHNIQSDIAPIIGRAVPNTVHPVEAHITEPPKAPVVKRATIYINTSSIQSDADRARASLKNFNINTSSIQSDADRVRASLENFNINTSSIQSDADRAKTYVAPTIVFDKRVVSVVSSGLTCYGQAVVTMSAADASAQIASATSAASGIRYYADGSSGTSLPTSTSSTASTSISSGSAAMITRGPMLAVGGAAVAFAFAAM